MSSSSACRSITFCCLLDDLVDRGLDLAVAGAEAQDAEACEESAVDCAAGEHHAAACVDSLQQPVSRLVVVGRRDARRLEMECEERELRRDDQPDSGTRASRSAASTASARFSAMAARNGGAEGLDREPDAQAGEAARQLRAVLGWVVELIMAAGGK